MALIFIHPGTHKTATTTIQSVLERKSDAAVALTTPRNYRKSAFDQAWRRGDPGTHAALFVEEFVTADIALISEERLLGQPTGQPALFARRAAFGALTADLKALGHDVHVLLTLRKPFDFLRSWYLQVLFSGVSNASFLSFIETSKVSDFSYANLLSDIEVAVPATILPFELLKTDRPAFIAGLNDWLPTPLFTEADFADVKNPSLGKISYQIMRSVSLDNRRDAARLGQLVKAEFVDDTPFDVLGAPVEMLLRTALVHLNSAFIDDRIADPRVKAQWRHC